MNGGPKGFRRFVCHALAAVAAAVVSVPFVMLLDRRDVLTIHEVSISPSTVSPGGAVTLHWAATEHRNCSGMVYRRIIDSRGTVFNLASVPTVYHDLMVVTPRQFETQFNIPLGVADGQARYIAHTERWCNFLQENIWRMTTPAITVKFNIGRG